MANGKKHEVVIVFSGVVALGPPVPQVEPFEEDGPLFGVMPVSGRRRITYHNTAGEEVTEFSRVHLPVIFSKLESTGRKPDDAYHRFGIWYPIRERLQIAVDRDPTAGRLIYVHDSKYGQPGSIGDPEGTVPALDPIEDIAAVPDMRIIAPSRSTLLPGVLDPDATGVSAQVFVPGGTVKAGAEDKRKFGVKVSYPSTSPIGIPRDAIVVPQVRITVPVDDELTILSASLDTREELDAISFQIAGNGEIWIANLDVKDVRAIINRLVDPKPQGKGEQGEPEPRCDVDFGRFYDIVDGTGDLVVPCDKPLEAGERKCYTVMMNPPPKK